MMLLLCELTLCRRSRFYFRCPFTVFIHKKSSTCWGNLSFFTLKRECPTQCIDFSVVAWPADGRGDQQATDVGQEGHHGVQWRLRGGSGQTGRRGARYHDQAASCCGETHRSRHCSGMLLEYVCVRWIDTGWGWTTGAGGNYLNVSLIDFTGWRTGYPCTLRREGEYKK